jgi:single-strand DNA-binding protein
LRNKNITGNITADPQIHTPENSEWKALNFSIANNDEKRQENNEWKEIVSFFNVTYWTKGNKLQNHLKKGKGVAISGRLKQEHWEKDGDKKNAVKIIASEVRPFVYEKSNDSAPTGTPPDNSNPQNGNYKQNSSHFNDAPDFDNSDGEIPF